MSLVTFKPIRRAKMRGDLLRRTPTQTVAYFGDATSYAHLIHSVKACF